MLIPALTVEQWVEEHSLHPQLADSTRWQYWQTCWQHRHSSSVSGQEAEQGMEESTCDDGDRSVLACHRSCDA